MNPSASAHALVAVAEASESGVDLRFVVGERFLAFSPMPFRPWRLLEALAERVQFVSSS